MIEKRKVLAGFAILITIAIFLSCSVGYQLFFRGCILWSCAPPRTFSVFDLSLPTHLFPNESVINAMTQPSELLGAAEAANMTVYWNEGSGLAVYDVQRFATEPRAVHVYQALTEDLLVFSEHDPIEFSSQLADNYSLVCGPSEFGGYRCWFISRYAEYVLSLNATIDEKMSFEQFEHIVLHIDEQMKNRLGS